MEFYYGFICVNHVSMCHDNPNELNLHLWEILWAYDFYNDFTACVKCVKVTTFQTKQKKKISVFVKAFMDKNWIIKQQNTITRETISRFRRCRKCLNVKVSFGFGRKLRLLISLFWFLLLFCSFPDFVFFFFWIY